MSGHKRVKNIDYDDYEYDDFADEPIPDSAVSENSDNFTEDDRGRFRDIAKLSNVVNTLLRPICRTIANRDYQRTQSAT